VNTKKFVFYKVMVQIDDLKEECISERE